MIFTEAEHRALREAAGHPFVDLSPELVEALRSFATHLMFWMGNTNAFSVKELHKIWRKSPELRQWLSQYVNLASYTLYYGARLKAGQHVKVGDAWKGPRGTQHWSTKQDTSRWFAGIGMTHAPDPTWAGGAIVEARATKSQVIVDVDRFNHVCGQHRAEFAAITPNEHVRAMFDGTAYEGEVMTTAAVKGHVIQVEWFQ